ncbi:MAG: Mur ligase family protein [Oceanipulchritudo sp.]
MARLEAEQAATITDGCWRGGHPSGPLTSFSIDTRTLQPGETFVALKTDRRDGHAYLEEAARRGALAALVQTPFEGIELPQMVVDDTWRALQALGGLWRQHFQGTVAGITGSYGKTTVKEFLGRVLGSHWYRTPGNLNNRLGVPLCLLELDRRKHAGALIEAGISGPGEMEVLAGMMDPDLAIVTAVGPAHLEGLGSLEGVARAKAQLARAVRPGGKAVFPRSLLQYEAFRDLPEGVTAHAVTVFDERAGGREGGFPVEDGCLEADYTWKPDEIDEGTGRLVIPGQEDKGLYFAAGSPGMISNLALVVHSARLLGVPMETLQSRIDGWRPYHQRGEIYADGPRRFFADCYNASPGSMIDSLRRFQNLFAGEPKFLVIGSMDELGAESEYWHRWTAREFALEKGAIVFLKGRGKVWMKEELESSGHPAGHIILGESVEDARRRLQAFEGAVFLKGSRSHGLESLIPEDAERC